MRDRSLDYGSFFQQIEEIARKYSSKIFRDSAPDNPKWLSEPDFENDFYLCTRSLRKMVMLAILSWYVPEEYGILWRLTLEDAVHHNPDYFVLTFLIRSKGEMRCFLYETELWHSRDFFGNIFRKNMKVSDLPVRPVRRKKSKPKRTQRHRGYRDKGTLKFPHEYHDFSNRTLEEKVLEEERSSLKDVSSFIEGWIT